ncbi:MAG: hypothetical protein KAW39_03130 [Thermoplasmata archaeon]|nr:hypothetical protein [Thermoplasmata archaeon]
MSEEDEEAGEEEEEEEESIDFLANLGIAIEAQDWQYFILSAFEITMSPESVNRRLLLLPEIMDRTIPDTEFTRKRAARFLLGLERLIYASRKLLAADGVNVIDEIIGVFRKAIDETIPKEGEARKEDFERFRTRIDEEFSTLIARIAELDDPDIQEAIEVLATVPLIFDYEKEDFDVLGVKEFDIKSLEEAKPAEEDERKGRREEK